MTSRDSFLQMWGMEAAATQRVLAAVPEKDHNWKPDPKSRSAIELSAFVAGHAPILATFLEKGEVKPGPMAPPKSVKDAAGMFASALPQVEKLLKSVDEKTWDTKMATLYAPDGSVMQSAPLGGMAWFTLFDLIHHRGQLSTYIRPLGGKVPSIYGPSADDPGR
ncbi:MAG TPA: DinB family protein [Spirochaetia bacterium]|nr:DinB family protein [Spirochaetia bacterium]